MRPTKQQSHRRRDQPPPHGTQRPPLPRLEPGPPRPDPPTPGATTGRPGPLHQVTPTLSLARPLTLSGPGALPRAPSASRSCGCVTDSHRTGRLLTPGKRTVHTPQGRRRCVLLSFKRTCRNAFSHTPPLPSRHLTAPAERSHRPRGSSSLSGARGPGSARSTLTATHLMVRDRTRNVRRRHVSALIPGEAGAAHAPGTHAAVTHSSPLPAQT